MLRATLAAVQPRLAAHPAAARGLGVKAECVVFDVAKLLRLCASANPNVLELLFSDERDWVLETPAWRRLHEERHSFLTQKVQQTFHGYAMAQLKKIAMRGMPQNIQLRQPKRDGDLVHQRLVVAFVDDGPIEPELPMLQ